MSILTTRTGATCRTMSARRVIAAVLAGLALATVSSSDASATGGPAANSTAHPVPPRLVPQPCDSIMAAGDGEPPTLGYRDCPPFTWPAPCPWVSPLGGYDAAQRYPAPCPDAAVTRPGDRLHDIVVDNGAVRARK